MAPQLSHRETKERYLKYREVARKLYESEGSDDGTDRKLTVETHATVQMTENGAFVEAMVWVPKEELDK